MKVALLSLVLAVGISTACVTAPPGQEADRGTPPQQEGDGGVQDSASTTDAGAPPTPDAGTLDGGATGDIAPVEMDGGSLTLDPSVALPVPPDPSPDDPRACDPQVLPAPNLGGIPDRPCTVDDGSGTTTYRYDATGRVVYRDVHTTYGYDATYTSEDDGGVRIDTLIAQGRTSTQDVTSLKDGKPAETDHFTGTADGGLLLDGHSTWLYDDKGRQHYVITQSVGRTREVERYLYDRSGRLYYVDQSYYWPGHTVIAQHNFTARSWFANGRFAHEVRTCDIVGGAPCGKLESRWEPCGNLTYSARLVGSGRGSSAADWSWDQSGKPLALHQWWTTTQYFESTESYHVDGDRVVSGRIVITNPPGFGMPVTEEHEASYNYDDAGRLIERLVDGKTQSRARFDAEGRLVELINGNSTTRWTYDGCGR